MRPLRFAYPLALFPITAVALPPGFTIREFAGPPKIEYPTAISAAANGDVYVSSDKNGSLGHEKNFGKIVRARDNDGDGKADIFVDFVPDVNSPRGGHFTGGTFYLINPPYLTSYKDTNGDGVSDVSKVLVTGFGWGIEHPRGADHTTNGVRMGIDGWLYVAVGDFGMPKAKAADGGELTLQGGGVVRVRPDGSEMEPYATMCRNICDTAISPYLDLFSRDNTNDGKGWNTRFHHFTSLLDHGYPRLYQNFKDEAVAPLADYGGGSGTGGLYLHEPGFPENFGDMAFTCDWTTGNIHYHPMKPFETSFVTGQETFQKLGRAIDIDVDGFSRLYLADWREGAYQYTPDKKVGMIQQVICSTETPAKYVDVTKADDLALAALLASRSGVQRLEAQREIIARGPKAVFAEKIHALSGNSAQPLYVRVAAIFTFKQLYGKSSTKYLLERVADASIREFVLRAMTDRMSELEGVPLKPYIDGLKDTNPRVRLQAAIGLGRLGSKAAEAAPALLAAAATWDKDESKLEKGAHYRLPLTAVKALVKIGNVPACIAALKAPAMRPIALSALQEIHGAAATDGLIAVVDSSTDPATVEGAVGALARLYHIEKPWDLKAWWNTRPDDRGPYFEPVVWEKSPAIKQAIERGFGKVPEARHPGLIDLLGKNRMQVSDLKLGNLDPVVSAMGASVIDDSKLRILLDASRDTKRTWDQRIECYRALNRAAPQKVMPTRLAVLTTWSGEKEAPPAVAKAIEDFVNETQRGSEISELRTLAAKQSDATSRIAWKSMLTVLNSPLAKDDAKKKVRAAIDENPREVGFFLALTDLKLSGFDPQIAVGMGGDNQILISAAKAAKEAGSAAAGSGKKVAELSPADVMKHAMEKKGDVSTGSRLYTAQGCIACHSIDPTAEQKGPYLGAAGAKFTRDYLIDSILDPNKIVAQGFRTSIFQMADGSAKMGFVTGEADGVIDLRDITGQASKINRADVKEEKELPNSMMPPGLGAGLSVEDFTSLIEYLVSLKAVGG